MRDYVFDPAEADAVVGGDKDHRPVSLQGWVASGSQTCDFQVLRRSLAAQRPGFRRRPSGRRFCFSLPRYSILPFQWRLCGAHRKLVNQVSRVGSRTKYTHTATHMPFFVDFPTIWAYESSIHERIGSMSRMRSPSYPSVPLRQGIDLVAKVHRTCRTNVITRENAVREMGYSGLTGRSMKVLAALLQFGLLEKTGRGDVKVTQRAVDILHGIDPADRNEAIREAAYSPQLFRDIHERFPEGIPSEGVIRSYLIQQDFMDAAIGPAINAFMETYRDVEHIREVESHSDDPVAAPVSVSSEEPEKPRHTQGISGLKPDPTAGMSADQTLNKINMNIQGDRVLVSGLFDLKGLRALEKKIAGLKVLLSDEDEEDETPPVRGFPRLNPDSEDDGSEYPS